VAFEVLPAIDVAGGRLVSASRAGVRPIDAFGGSPMAAAEAFVEAGATWLHVVDVDRADGRPPDLETLRRLAGVAFVQASGGIETLAAAADALDAGAARAVLGSAILADPASLADALGRLQDRVVVGVEADGELIRPRSAGARELPLRETLGWLRSTDALRYLYTGLGGVARLRGPDLEGARLAAEFLRRPVLLAGGVRGLDDVLAAHDLGPSVVAGVVVGRALYDGLDLREVLAVAEP